MKQLKQDLSNWRKEKIKEWCQDTTRVIDDPSQALRLNFYLIKFFNLFVSIYSLERTGRLMKLDSCNGK